MNNNPASEAFNELANSNNSVTDLTRIAIPYILHGFNKGIEGRHLVGISLQSASDSPYRASLKSVLRLGEPTESGFIAYSSGDTIEELLDFFESSLSWGDLKWRVDQYHKNSVSATKNSREGRSKIKLR